jgi:hypothetical protein
MPGNRLPSTMRTGRPVDALTAASISLSGSTMTAGSRASASPIRTLNAFLWEFAELDKYEATAQSDNTFHSPLIQIGRFENELVNRTEFSDGRTLWPTVFPAASQAIRMVDRGER